MQLKLVVAGLSAVLAASAAVSAQAPADGYQASAKTLYQPTRGHARSAKAQGRHVGSLKLPAPQAPSLAGYPTIRDARLGTTSFLWADASIRPALVAPLRRELIAESAAREYLGAQATQLGADRKSIGDARLVELHDSGRGPVVARYQQRLDGVEVFGKRVNVMMDRGMKLVATSGNFSPATVASTAPGTKASGAQASKRFELTAEQAIAAALRHLTGTSAAPRVTALGASGEYTRFQTRLRTRALVADGPARARRYWYPNGADLVPAWYAEVSAREIDTRRARDYGYLISARDGAVLFRKNLRADDATSYRVYADGSGTFQPYDSPLGNGYDPFVGTPGNGNLPRTPATTALVTLQNGPISTNDPWLAPGALETTGNNVDAFLDLSAPDGFTPASNDIRGAITGGNSFDYPYTPDSDPNTPTQRQFAAVNLFYLNNWLHDFWYDSGFNEAAGNAQASNYGRGGVEGDAISAQGQDNSGRNNANMSTPPDGGSPRMQMYLFDGPVDGEVTIVTPPALAGSLAFGIADYGARGFDVTGDLVHASPNDGCTALANAGAVAGHIALIDRGNCSFASKTLNAQNAGATAVLLADNVDEPPLGLAGDDTITDPITIGTLSIGLNDGTAIATALSGGSAVNARLRLVPVIDYDGTVDNQIISHEFFHYVSNRLIGDALGLTGSQGDGMGEGWSDFDSMLLTVRDEDRLVSGNDHYQGAYPQAYYATHDAYFGIRRAPYSTSMATFPLSFRHIENGVALPSGAPLAFGADGADNAEAHNAGEIWCETLWEIYAALLNDSARYTFAQARRRMQDYIIAGLKMTPNQPTMLEARDALLAAARATDAQDFTLMATAFAKRGMGVGAVAPDRYDPDNRGVVESYVALAGGFEVVDAAIDYRYSSGADGYIDDDGELDPGETALLTLSIRSDGTQDITAPVTANFTSDGDVTFGNGGSIVFPASSLAPLAPGATATASITVKLNSATQTAQTLHLAIAFPEVGASAGEVVEAPTQTLSLIVNYDLAPRTRASDDLEQPASSLADWTRTASAPGVGWDLVDGSDPSLAFGTGLLWFAADVGSTADLRLVTPPLVVGSGAFTLAFDHYYQFEFDGSSGTGFDGGVIELSSDGGATWIDVLDAGGSFTSGSGYTGPIEALGADGSATPDDSGSHPGFIGDNFAANSGLLEHVVLSFDGRQAGKTVLLRFRLVSDSSGGDFGWAVDNVALTGLATPPFSTVVAENNVPDNRPPVANAGADSAVAVGDAVTLDGSASSDPDGNTLSYAWSQTAGPTTTIGNAGSAMATVRPAAAGNYVFLLTVTDTGGFSSTDSVSISVSAKPSSSGGGVVAPGLLLTGLLLALLRRRRERH